MGSARMWLLLVGAQVVTLLGLAAAGPVTAATPALRYIGIACLAGIFACVPPLVVKLFVAAQTRVGHGAHPMVSGLREHEALVVGVVWVMMLGTVTMAWPYVVADLRADRDRAAASDADPVALQETPHAATEAAPGPPGAAAAPGDAGPVSSPGPGAPERAAILDALRQRLKTSNRFRVGHLRVAAGWAFVRATEVVPLEGGEGQETDLTVAALLERPPASTTGWWRIADYWTLPDEAERPLAEFARRVRARVRAERLPVALLPDDLWAP